MNDKKEILEEMRKKILSADLVDPGAGKLFLLGCSGQMFPYIPEAMSHQNNLLSAIELQRKLIDLIDNFK